MNRPALCCILIAVFGLSPASWSESFEIYTLAGKPGLAGSGDGTNQNAGFNGPAGLTVDIAGNVYVADGNAIRKMTPYRSDWAVTTLAGVVGSHGAVDATGAQARFNFPQGVAVDSQGNIFVADTYNEAIRKVTPFGAVTTIAGLAGPINDGSADGTNSFARFNSPQGIAVAADGLIFVADTFNHTIRRVAQVGANWVTTTIAGQARATGTTDGAGAAARFNRPLAIAAESASSLYVADFENHTIRHLQQVGTNWVVSTVAGLGGQSGTSDGLGAAARFNKPDGLALDGSGVLVADGDSHTLRRIRGGVVTTVAGGAGLPALVDGLGSAARFNYPYGLAADPFGRLFISDNGNFVVRMGASNARLYARISGNKLLISWPTNSGNVILQSSSSLLPSATWNSENSSVIVSGNNYLFAKDLTAGAPVFYRLVKP